MVGLPVANWRDAFGSSRQHRWHDRFWFAESHFSYRWFSRLVGAAKSFEIVPTRTAEPAATDNAYAYTFSAFLDSPLRRVRSLTFGKENMKPSEQSEFSAKMPGLLARFKGPAIGALVVAFIVGIVCAARFTEDKNTRILVIFLLFIGLMQTLYLLAAVLGFRVKKDE